ncbi:MAG: lysophospholipid transporter LplT [Gammaproteobacteria bacterium]|nr:lysophospholipid transporter LplT [Gammaproteobacteria bacterium]
MNKSIVALIFAQFLSAFGDNAILFAVVALVMQHSDLPSWYIPAIQSVFIFAYIALAPFAGPFADQHQKRYVLLIGNVLKALGAMLILIKVEPLIAFILVGAGAALYSPAKYGILPELVDEDELVKANSWVEGSTIVAILLGMVVGAKVADHSIPLALQMTIVLFFLSAAATLMLPSVMHSGSIKPTAMDFIKDIKLFVAKPIARFSLFSAALFWSAAAVLRVMLVAWGAIVLGMTNASDVAQLTLFLAIGIIIGAALAPKFIPMHHLRRVRFAGFALGFLILALGFVTSLIPAQITLLVIGIAGGLYIVPINATLQEIGHQSIGSGSAVAILNFCNNTCMLISVGIYTLAESLEFPVVHSVIATGLVVLFFATLVTMNLPKKTEGLVSGD